MELLSIILLTMVLSEQIFLVVLHFREKRRHDTMVHYIDSVLKTSISEISCGIAEKLDAHFEKTCEYAKFRDEKADAWKKDIMNEIIEAIFQQEKTISERMNDFLLDYTQAQEAANKVNDFASSLASIFDYDPLKAARKGRSKEAI